MSFVFYYHLFPSAKKRCCRRLPSLFIRLVFCRWLLHVYFLFIRKDKATYWANWLGGFIFLVATQTDDISNQDIVENRFKLRLINRFRQRIKLQRAMAKYGRGSFLCTLLNFGDLIAKLKVISAPYLLFNFRWTFWFISCDKRISNVSIDSNKCQLLYIAMYRCFFPVNHIYVSKNLSSFRFAVRSTKHALKLTM